MNFATRVDPPRYPRRGPGQEEDGDRQTRDMKFQARRNVLRHSPYRNDIREMAEYGIRRWSSIEIYGLAMLRDRDYISSAKNDFDSLQARFIAPISEDKRMAR